MEDAASLLRAARRRAGLSQVELAGRLGVAQSVISAYETGKREPSLATLRRFVDATGNDLELTIVTRGTQPRRLPDSDVPDTELGRRLRQCRRRIYDAAAGRGASNIRVFGSVARGDDTASSDVDLLVDLEEGTSLLDLIGLEHELAEILGADVDVVPAASLKAHIKERVLAEAVAL